MKLNIDGKSVLIIILLMVILGSWIFRSDISRLLGESKEKEKQLIEVQKELSQGIIDSLALVPVYEARIDSLEHELLASESKIEVIHERADSLRMVIDNNTVTDDMRFYANYIDDSIPKLLKLERVSYVAITPKQLKRTNLIFVSHEEFARERVELLGSIGQLKHIQATQSSEISLLKNTMDLCNERYQVNLDLINEKNTQIKLQRKQKRRRTWGIIGGALIGFGVGAVLVH